MTATLRRYVVASVGDEAYTVVDTTTPYPWTVVAGPCGWHRAADLARAANRAVAA